MECQDHWDHTSHMLAEDVKEVIELKKILIEVYRIIVEVKIDCIVETRGDRSPFRERTILHV